MARDARVLVVDGDESVRALLGKALLDREVRCECVATTDDALAALGKHRYALVVLQLEIEGVERVMAWSRALGERQRPIVIMTAERRAEKDSVDADIVQIIIRRPLRVQEVAAIIHSCLAAVAIDSEGEEPQ